MGKMLRLIVLLLIAWPVLAESLFDNKLQFSLPSGFRRMTSQEIGLKYPAVHPPQFVYTNEGLTCSVAFTHSTSKLVPADLSKFKDFMQATLQRQQPGLEWETSEIKQVGGLDWMHFVFASQGTNTAPQPPPQIAGCHRCIQNSAL